MRDIVILFGAGASYGCGGVIPEQPPLGSQLFPILKSNYPSSWGSLPPHIDKLISNDFEEGMQLIYNELGNAIPILMREMALYLIQFRPHKSSTLYDLLISDIKSANLLERVIFSTLNYDCVLEFCLINSGHNISYFEDEKLDAVPVWKLHGSSNMFSHGVHAGQGVSYGTGVTWEGGVEAFLDPNRVIQKCLVETGLAPIMCLYMEGKILNVSPSAIQSLQELWAERVRNAGMIISIGVRPVLGDTHIWGPLADSDATLCFIGNQAEFEDWTKKFRNRESVYLGNRFGNSYSNLKERLNGYEH